MLALYRSGERHRLHVSTPLFLAALLLLELPVQAALRFWDGGGANNLWTTAANWGGVAPAPGVDDLVFPGGGGVDPTSLNNTNNFADKTPFRSITFTGTNYALYGNAIYFTNTGVTALSAQHGGGTNSVNVAILFDSGGQTFECTAAAATLIVNGDITMGTNDLTNSISGRIRLRGLISEDGDLVKTGTGTLNIEGSAGANTFTGVTRVNAGTVELGKSSAIRSCFVGDGAGTDTVRYLVNNAIGTFPVQVNAGGVLDLNGFSATSPGIGSLTINGGAVTMGAGTLRITGNFFGLSSGTLGTVNGILDLGGATRTFDIANGPINPDIVISAVVTNGGINKNGNGNLRLSGANVYTNQTTINAGFIMIQNAAGLGTTQGPTVLNGGNLLIEGVSVTGEALTNSSSSSILQASGLAVWSGPVVLGQQLDVNIIGTSLDISGPISGSGSLIKAGPGTLIYSGTSPNTYTNTTSVNEGTLQVSKTGAGGNSFLGPLIVGDGLPAPNSDHVIIGLGSQLGSQTPVTVNSSGRIEFITGDNFGSLSGSGNVVLTGGATIIGLFSSTSAAISGIISGNGGITKGGNNRLTLTGANTYTGLTTVEAGILYVEGPQPQSHVRMLGGTLAGSGIVGNITNTSGGAVAPGSSPGTLICSNVTFAGATSDFLVELGGPLPGSGHDQLNSRGGVSVSNCTLNVSLVGGFAPLAGQSFVILNNDGADAIAGTFNGLPEAALVDVGALKFRISYAGGISNNDVILSLTNPPLQTVVSTAVGGNGDSSLDPNECNHLYLTVTNTTGAAISNITATLTANSPHLIVLQSDSAYPNLAANAQGTNTTPFQIATLPSLSCGAPINLILTVTSSAGNFAVPIALISGTSSAPLRFDNNSLTAIPDGNFVDSTNIVSGITSSVSKVTVSLYITHDNSGDLDLRLIGPDGTSVALSQFHGGTGNDYGIDCVDSGRTVFDDAAATPIASGTAPFTNTYRPDGVLATYVGKTGADVNGAWRLRVEDDVLGTGGTLRCWSLFVSQLACSPGGGICETCPGFVSGAVSPADPTNSVRMFRDGINSSCGVTKICPGGTPSGAPFHYDTHIFTNAGPEACVTVYLSSLCDEAMYASAYLGSFEPTNLCANYLADMGRFPSPPFNSFSFNVPAATNFVVVVTETSDGAGCDYTLVATGIPCPPPVLNIAPVPFDQVRLFWPTHAAGFLLEANPELGTSNWNTVPNVPIVVGPDFNVTNHTGFSNRFYRLHKP